MVVVLTRNPNAIYPGRNLFGSPVLVSTGLPVAAVVSCGCARALCGPESHTRSQLEACRESSTSAYPARSSDGRCGAEDGRRGRAGGGKNEIGTEMEDHVNMNARTHGDFADA